MKKKVSVVVVDDSAIIRGLVIRALESDPLIDVVGSFMHGQYLLNWLETGKTDVVVLDVEMPVMDGLETLKRVQSEYPEIKVVMASSLTEKGGRVAVKAMAMGAVDCIGKPVASSAAESVKILATQLVPIVKSLGAIDEEEPEIPPKTKASHANNGHITKKSVNLIVCQPEIIVIGSSTGGPKALTKFLTGLPKDFKTPMFIVQHMPATFTPMLAMHLSKDTGRPCMEAEDGAVIKEYTTYVAPGDYHLELVRHKKEIVMRLNQKEPQHYCRPSVNPLFESATKVCGKKLLAVILTGMGDDGIEGTREVVKNNGFVIAQDEETCVVWGMPRAVVHEGLADRVLPIDSIASEVRRICLLETC